jgi:hypothetical protein
MYLGQCPHCGGHLWAQWVDKTARFVEALMKLGEDMKSRPKPTTSGPTPTDDR